MKKVFATISAASLAVGLAGASSHGASPAPVAKKTHEPTKAEQRAQLLKNSAPGDEYFGRLKMSYLGINNVLRDEAVRAGDYTTNESIVHTVAMADDALADWRRKYPNDPQLARTFYLMGRMQAKIWTLPAQQRAVYYYQALQNQFPKTYFGKLMKAQLSKGFTEHVLADALPCPTPVPTPTPTPTPHPRGYRATPAPSASPVASDTPSPTPSPSATPIPTPPPNSNIHLVVVPQPCFVVTPSPSPTPEPTVTPSGSPLPLPSGSLSPRPSGSPPPAPTPTPTPTPHRS